MLVHASPINMVDGVVMDWSATAAAVFACGPDPVWRSNGSRNVLDLPHTLTG